MCVEPRSAFTTNSNEVLRGKHCSTRKPDETPDTNGGSVLASRPHFHLFWHLPPIRPPKPTRIGADAEARNDYIKAYEEYKQAFDLKPKEIKYRAAYTRIRFYASSEFVHQGELLRKQGKLQDALVLFQTRCDDRSQQLRRRAGSQSHSTRD